jgi:hypothetical protein
MRRLVQWGTVAIGIGSSVPILKDLWYNYGMWRKTVNDPSAKDAYLTFIEVDVGLFVFVVIVAAAILRVLRVRKPRRETVASP